MLIVFKLGQKTPLRVKSGTHGHKVSGEVVATGGGHTDRKSVV